MSYVLCSDVTTETLEHTTSDHLLDTPKLPIALQ